MPALLGRPRPPKPTRSPLRRQLMHQSRRDHCRQASPSFRPSPVPIRPPSLLHWNSIRFQSFRSLHTNNSRCPCTVVTTCSNAAYRARFWSSPLLPKKASCSNVAVVYSQTASRLGHSRRRGPQPRNKPCCDRRRSETAKGARPRTAPPSAVCQKTSRRNSLGDIVTRVYGDHFPSHDRRDLGVRI